MQKGLPELSYGIVPGCGHSCITVEEASCLHQSSVPKDGDSHQGSMQADVEAVFLPILPILQQQ